MRKLKQLGYIGAVLVTGAAILTSAAFADQVPPPGTPDGGAGIRSAGGLPGARTVTLVTGDKVTVGKLGGRSTVRVRPAPGRRVHFERPVRDGHQYVIPSDARRLIGQGRLDPRLFDVTQLLEWGYDDARSADLPLIVNYTAGQPKAGTAPKAAAAASKPAPFGARTVRALPTLGGQAVRVGKPGTARFWSRLAPRGAGSAGAPRTLAGGVAKVWLDGKRKALLDKSVPQIGAPAAWKKGLTGKGTTVAVLDTGYDTEHADLAGVVTKAKGFTDKGAGDIADKVGHGTHVASTVAGSGKASGGKYKGVAPDATIVSGKVLDDEGSGLESWILAGMEWAATEARAKVVNLSLGGLDLRGEDPLEQAVNRLTASTGSLFVIAAGNEGFLGDYTIGSPASADAALAVGAVDRENALADFSSRGPRLGDHAVKPEITAPGVEIAAAKAKGSDIGEPVGKHYQRLSGTSMATPHVAGAAAILAQRHPDWKADRLKAALVGSAKPTSGTTAFEQGAGRVDVARAVDTPVTAGPAGISAYLRWPKPKPQSHKVTYHNESGKAVTLKLAVSAGRHGGGKAPKGLFTPSARTVRVPAKGDATVDVTISAKGVKPGAYGGTLTATAGEQTVRTIVGAHVEPKSYDLTVKAIDHNGKPAAALLTVGGRSAATEEMVGIEPGGTRLRLPATGHNVYGFLETEGSGDGCTQMTFVHVPVELTGDRTVIVDGRAARRLSTRVDEPTAENDGFLDIGMSYEGKGGAGYATGVIGDCPLEMMSVLPVRDRGLSYYNHTTWLRRGWTPDKPSPFRYEVYDLRTGELPEDPSYAAVTSEMAAVREVYHAQGGAGHGYTAIGAQPPGAGLVTVGSFLTRLPATVTTYLTPGPRLTWLRGLEYGAESPEEFPTAGLEAPARTFRKGAHREVWNAAVIGPTLDVEQAAGTRNGDTVAYVPDAFFADGVRGHVGYDMNATGTLTLASGGKVIERAPFEGGELSAKVSAKARTYTLTAAATRTTPGAALSTGLEAAWTFRSARSAEAESLPLRMVRYAPAGLDGLNRAPAGSTVRVPLWLEHNPGVPAAKAKSIKVEMSGDDGKTWRPVTVTPDAEGWVAEVPTPAKGTVSLRAEVTSSAGDRVRLTAVRAYGVRP